MNSGVSPDVTPNNNNNNTVNDIVCNNNNNKINNNYNNNNTFSNSCDKTIDENILNLTNCKYYTVSEFHHSADNHSLNIFHNNVNVLETKFENLHHFLSNASTKFDIAITETSQRIINEEFYTNIDFSTATNTNKGGTIIYTKIYLMSQKG